VLAALTVISCDIIFPPESAPGEPAPAGYTSKGTPLVELVIGVDDGRTDRALTTTLAQAAVDFYEVIFLLDGELSRTSWKESQTAKLAVPHGTYSKSGDSNTGKAYLFAGRVDAANTKTLLAVGKLAKVNDTDVDDETDVVINSSTTHVTFSLAALETNVNAADPLMGTFQWDGDVTAFTDTTAASLPVGVGIKTDVKDINGRTIPAFIMKPDPADTDNGNKFTATFSFTFNGGYREEIMDALRPSPKAGEMPDIILTRAGLSTAFDPIDIAFDSDASIAERKFDLEEDSDNITKFTWDEVNNSLSVKMFFTTGDTPGKGYSLMYFQVPVCLLSAEYAAGEVEPEQWYLRGGIQNKLPDGGVNSLGGAVLIGTYIP
jgi:hypothetical protein